MSCQIMAWSIVNDSNDHVMPALADIVINTIQGRAKKSVPDKKRDVGMEGFYKRQSHTYVIASTGCYQSPLAIT